MKLNTIASYNRTTIIYDKIGVEDGYTKNPNDHGGATTWGITEAVARKYEAQMRALFNWDGDMRHLTPAMAEWIYIQDYWNALNLDLVFAAHPLLADKLFDIGINMGTSTAAKFFQRALNVLNKQQAWYNDLKIDGDIGPGTVGALRAYLAKRSAPVGTWHLLVMLCALQGERYIGISENNTTQETFTDGWIDRTGRDMGHYALLTGHAI